MDKFVSRARELAAQPVNRLHVPITNRIAYVVSHGASYASHGYAVRTQGIAQSLNDAGLDCMCFVRPGRPWDLGRAVRLDGPEVSVDGVRYIHTRWPKNESPLGEAAYFEATVDKFIELFSVYRPTAVMAASNWAIGLPAWVASKQLGLPFYYEVRGFWGLSRDAREPGYINTQAYQSELERETFVAKQAQKVFTLNNPMRDELIKQGVPANKIEIVANGVLGSPNSQPADRTLKKQLGIKPGERVIGYIGSFSPYEGLDILLDACTDLVRQGETLKLLLVGDNQPLTLTNKNSTCIVDIANTGLTDIPPWLIQIGRVPYEQVADYYALMDVVVIPRKPLAVCQLVPPMKAVEALAYGKRLVVSDVAPLLEYANMYDGVISFTAGSRASIVTAIQAAFKPSVAKPTRAVSHAIPIEPIARLLRVPIVESFNHGQKPAPESEKTRISRLSLQEQISNNDNSNYLIKNLAVAEHSLKSIKPIRHFYSDRPDKRFTKLIQTVENNPKSYVSTAQKAMNSCADGMDKVAIEILLQGLGLFPKSISLLSSLFWSFQRLGDFKACNELIGKIEKVCGLNPTSTQLELLKKLKKTPAYQLSIFNHIGDVTPTSCYKKNKVAYVLHNSLPYSSGGYATRGDGFTQGLISCGLDVVVLSRPGFPLDINDDISEFEIPLVDNINGVEYRRILSPERRGVSALEYMQKASDAIKYELQKVNPAIVIAASNHITAIPAYLASKRLGLPFVYEVRGFWEITRLSREPEFANSAAYKIQVLLEGELAKRADQVFTLTQPMKEELICRGVEESKIELLPNSCNPERFVPCGRDQELAKSLGIPCDIPVIGYIGTFVAYEGLVDLARACSILKDCGYRFRLLLVGNENASGQERGPITEEVMSAAKAHGFEDWLIMPGRVPHEEVESYYSLIDVAPFPRKPWLVCEMVSPMKPLEALAMEKAVVVSSVRALVEMVEEDKTGLVFEKGSAESLAKQLARLIDNPELRIKLGKAGRKWVEENRTWNATSQIALSKLTSLIALT